MQIPLMDLKAQYQSIKKPIDEAIQEVLNQSNFILGSQVKDFEKDFAVFCGASEVVGLSSGTSALELGFDACGLKAGDEVITTPLTWAATTFALVLQGIKPVFVDIDPRTYTLNPDLIQKAITPKTRAILPVHLYGQMADMEKIQKIAGAAKLKIIEDACQSHGARWKNQPVGKYAEFAAYSFYPGKNLGAFGDGGALTTSKPEIAEKIRLMRNAGQKVRHDHQVVGTNARLDTLQAAVLKVKLQHLKAWTEKRREAAARYDRLLLGLPITLPLAHPDAYHVYHLYVIQVPHRDETLKKLQDKGVQAQIHYPRPLHFLPPLQFLGHKKGDFPIAEKVAESVISLPLYPEITEAQQCYVADTLQQILK